MVRTQILRLLVIIAIVGVVATPAAQATASSPTPSGQTRDETMTYDGRERTFRVHTPAAETSAGLPVLIVLHGGGGNGKSVERSTGLSDLADREGFVVVYPDGTGRNAKRLTWDAHNCCAYALEEQVDDVGFISALIDQVIAEYGVDPTRVYVTGFSNGAMMTFRLACELSDKIAAAAPLAGALNTDSCVPSSTVPMLIMNGTDDANVPVAGGLSPTSGARSENDRLDRPTTYAVQTWVANNGCNPTPELIETAGVTTYDYTECANGATVEQILIHDWPHAWPSETNGAPLNGEEVIWSFVSQYSKPGA